MGKRKRRNTVTLVLLLLALLALILIYIWYNNRETREETKKLPETIELATFNKEELRSLHYISGDADLTLVLQDGIWVSESEAGRPINQDNVDRILTTFDEVKADRLINEAPDKLSDYGLDPYEAYLQVVGDDGSTLTVKIGSAAGTGVGYYGLVNEDNKVYLLPVEYGSSLQYSNAQMTVVAEGPEITAESIQHIEVIHRDGEDFEIKYIEDDVLDNSGSSLNSWRIRKPYGEGYSADESKLAEVLKNYTTFDFVECVDYLGNDLSRYGLEDPAASVYIGYYESRTVTLEKPETDPDTGEEITEKTYYDPKEYQLYVGDKNEEGQYYVRAEGSNAVYTMGAATVDKMLTMDTFSLLNRFVLIPNIDIVDRITFDIDGSTYNMELKRTNVKKETGEDEIQTTYYYNGSEVERQPFVDLYKNMVSPLYDAQIKGEAPLEEVNPYMTITYELNDEEHTKLWASFLPYNDSFYIVKTEAGTHFFADKRKIDDIAGKVASFQAK